MAQDGDKKGLQDHIAKLEHLVAECEQANDREAKMVLYLLREALEIGRMQLRRAGLRTTDPALTSKTSA
jgi:hypothetical protein